MPSGWRRAVSSGRRLLDESRGSSADLIAAEDDGVAGQAAIGGEKIEIDVAGRYRVRIGGSFDGQALRRVLDVLERR